MEPKRVPILFEDMSYHTEYRFLEMGKDDNELKDVATKAGIVYPSPDISIFKGRYALVDKQNRNRCTLPKEEVEKALETLRMKAVDIDHLRRYTVGTWLYGYMDGNEVITYGAFWKSNYPKEYEDFQGRMKNGRGVDISMEAWGNRIDKADKSGYSLVDIHFAGGALLDKEQPAEPSAGVLEFAKIMEINKMDPNAKVRNRGDVVFPAGSKNVNDNKDHFPINNKNQARNALARVAQYKSVPKWYDGPLSDVVDKVKNAVKNKYSDIMVSSTFMEKSRFYIWDMDCIMRLVYEAINPKTGKVGAWEICAIDFDNSTVLVEDMIEENRVEITLTPVTKDLGTEPVEDDADVEDAQASIPEKMSREILSIKQVEKINKSNSGGNNKMELEKKVLELEAALKVKDEQIAKLTKDIEDAKTNSTSTQKSLDEAKAALKTLEDSIPVKVEEAKKTAKIVEGRKNELGPEFSKDLTDEDILNDVKFENAKLKKEVAELKDPERATKNLEAGSTKKDVVDPSFASQLKAQEIAFGKK